MKRMFAPLAAALLAGCGNIPVGSVNLPDVTVTVPGSLLSPIDVSTSVVYFKQNQFGAQRIPALVNSVGIQGRAEYATVTGAHPAIQKVNVFVRPTLDGDLAGCNSYTDYVECKGDESGHAVGSIDFSRGNPTDFDLRGAPLLEAARNGEGYFGIQLAGRQVVSGDQLRLTQLRAVARF